MNQVTVEYVDERALRSSSLRRAAAAEVVLPHTYSKLLENPLLRRQQLVRAADRRHSVAGARPGGRHLDRHTAATHVVTGAERTDQNSIRGTSLACTTSETASGSLRISASRLRPGGPEGAMRS